MYLRDEIMYNKNDLAILKAMVTLPGRRWQLKELSKDASLPKATAWRAVKRLESQNFVDVERVGRSIVISLKNEPRARHAVKALSVDIDYMAGVAAEFARKAKRIKAVRRCILFGSVARGTAGAQSDIDVLVLVNDMKVDADVTLTAERVSSEKGVRLVPDVMTTEYFARLKKHKHQFAEFIRKEGVTL